MTKKKSKKKRLQLSASDKLNPKQKLFCEIYASDKELFANGVASYIEAYNVDTKKQGAYNSARSSAYDLLTKPYILDYINEILDLRGLNDTFVDKQLEFLVSQNADLRTKRAAIREYNELKRRITQKVEHSGAIKTESEEEINARLEELLARREKRA